jgi:hypothetical protein
MVPGWDGENMLNPHLQRHPAFIPIARHRGSRLVESLAIIFDLGYVFTTKASASSGLIQNLEPNWQLFGKISIFYEDFGSLMPFLVLNPER